MATLNKDVLQRLRDDEFLQLDIAKGMGRKLSTVKSWIRYNDDMLVSKAVLLIIKDVTGLRDSQILESTSATA